MEQNPNLLDYFSSIEVYNGSAEFSFPFLLPRKANDKTFEFYLDNICSPRLNIGMCSGTDGHSAEVIGTCYTEFPDRTLTSKNLSSDLDKTLREIKSPKNLHRQSNAKDAAQHTFNMILATILRKR